MQISVKEEPYMLLTILEDYYMQCYKCNNQLFKGGTVIDHYDIHDGKILYNLVQHSLWSRKYHPFVLCKCKRGQAVVNY